MRMKMMTRYW